MLRYCILIVLLIWGLSSEYSVIRPRSKVSVKVKDILDKQEAGSGRSSIARVIVPGGSLRPELPQSNPPSVESYIRPTFNQARTFQSYAAEQLEAGEKNDNLRPTSDYWTLRRLKRILGNDFDPDWMSITEPNPSEVTYPYGYPKPNIELIKSVDQMNLNLSNVYSSTIQPEYISLFKNWLLKKSTCEIKFVWDNLGDLYWPKYIRRGLCQAKTDSCSWPPGMRCKLNGGRTLKILRWKCDNQMPSEPDQRLYRRDSQQQMTGPWSSEFHRQKRQELTSKERREKRLRRLIRQLSVTKNGLHCRWTPYDHVVSDECACGCN